MASGGSSMRSVAGSKLFDFGSDEVLCSYEDYTPKVDMTINGKLLHPSAKDLHGSIVKSSSGIVCGQPEELSSEDTIYAVEKCMEKYADSLMKHLGGIVGRLNQFELYCCKLDRSIGEFRTDMVRDQSEANLKLKSIEKHVNEVHRSVQIIRDKQELTETQMELAKLQLPQRNSTQELFFTPPSLAITAPDQIHPYKELSLQKSAPVSLSVLPQDHYVLNPVNAYYTHLQPLTHERRSHNMQPEIYYAQQRPQMHDFAVNQPTQQQPFPILQAPPAYVPNAPNQRCNTMPETYPGSSMPLPASYYLQPQNNMLWQPLAQASQGSFVPVQLAKCGYVGIDTFPSVYVIDGSRASRLQNLQPGSYLPNDNFPSV